MNNKVLAKREGRNISLYSVTYDIFSLSEYIRMLDQKYTSTKKALIETTIYDDVVLSMGEFDLKKDECHVKRHKVIRDIEIINEHEKRSIVEVEVEYYSMIAKALRDTFIDEMPLLNATSLIFLMKSIYGFKNDFSYDSLIDTKFSSWDDPRRLSDVKFDLTSINRQLNSKRIIFNDLESKNTFDILTRVVEDLQKYITIEQIGLFPVEENMPELNSLLAAFAFRNEDCDLFFGSLDNVEINFNGIELLNNNRNDILDAYNLKEGLVEPQKQKNRMDVFNKFLQF